jgi:wyosine [tRNA(Phe)-imidazoG37] synthetase (radical SAM superfamily)
MKYIYGPVNSRRLGLSLGVSLTPHKTCSFDCIYCQLGKTSCLVTARNQFYRVDDVVRELRAWVDGHPDELKKLAYITIAGLGEPTLNTSIGTVITAIKHSVSTPVALITNASFFNTPAVRREVLEADLIVPSLDAVTQDVFTRINRPAEGILVEEIIGGLVALRSEYKGKLWLEVMVIRGYNDSDEHLRQLKETCDRIRPDKIQLNSPVRAPRGSDAEGISPERLEEFRRMLGEKCEIV